MYQQEDFVDRAIHRLSEKHTFHHRDQQLVVVCLIRTDDWRPLKAPWWKKKQASLIGVDMNGNFFLRCSDGSVRYWDHVAQMDELLTPSVNEFISQLV